MHCAILIGPISSPIDGRTMVTRWFIERVRSRNNSIVVDVGYGDHTSIIRSRLRKVTQHLRAMVLIFWKARKGTVYVAADAGLGLYLNLLVALIARLARASLIVHHHSRRYITFRNGRVGLLVSLCGKRGLHIFQCDRLGEAFAGMYGMMTVRWISVSNAAWIRDPQIAAVNCRDRAIGYLSNITYEKGIRDVLSVGANLTKAEMDFHLNIAGPVEDEKIKNEIEQAIRLSGGMVRYLGPLYGEKKQAFFASISVFLFPTHYSNETEGIVTLEAMSFGVPVVATNLACLADNLKESGGLAVDEADDFVSVATELITAWHKDAERLSKAQQRARKRFVQIRHNANTALDRLMKEF